MIKTSLNTLKSSTPPSYLWFHLANLWISIESRGCFSKESQCCLSKIKSTKCFRLSVVSLFGRIRAANTRTCRYALCWTTTVANTPLLLLGGFRGLIKVPLNQRRRAAIFPRRTAPSLRCHALPPLLATLSFGCSLVCRGTSL